MNTEDTACKLISADVSQIIFFSQNVKILIIFFLNEVNIQVSLVFQQTRRNKMIVYLKLMNLWIT